MSKFPTTDYYFITENTKERNTIFYKSVLFDCNYVTVTHAISTDPNYNFHGHWISFLRTFECAPHRLKQLELKNSTEKAAHKLVPEGFKQTFLFHSEKFDSNLNSRKITIYSLAKNKINIEKVIYSRFSFPARILAEKYLDNHPHYTPYDLYQLNRDWRS